MEATQEQAEQVERIWDAQLNYSMSRAKLESACDAIAKAVVQLGQALGDVESAARILGGMVAEFPTEQIPPEGLKDKEIALKEVDVWIASTKAAHTLMAPACFAIADVAAVLHNAEHGLAPTNATDNSEANHE